MAVQTVVHALAVGADEGERVGRVETAVAEELERVAVQALVPDLVTALTEAPEWTPFCADRPLVATLNSCSASGNGSGRFALFCGLLCMAPSSM